MNNTRYFNETFQNNSKFIYYWSYSILAIILNGLFLIQLFIKKRINSYSNLLFTSIILSQLLLSFFYSYIYIFAAISKIVCNKIKIDEYSIQLYDPFSVFEPCISDAHKIFNDIMFSSSDGFVMAYVNVLILLSYHRFRQIKYPFKENEILTRQRKIIIVFVWVLSICSINIKTFLSNTTLRKYVYRIILIVFFDIPLVLGIIIITMNLYLILKNQRMATKTLNTSNSRRMSHKTKAVYCLATLVTFQVLTWSITFIVIY